VSPFSEIFGTYAFTETFQFFFQCAVNALFEPSKVKARIELAFALKFECRDPLLSQVAGSWRSEPLKRLPDIWRAVPHR